MARWVGVHEPVALPRGTVLDVDHHCLVRCVSVGPFECRKDLPVLDNALRKGMCVGNQPDRVHAPVQMRDDLAHCFVAGCLENRIVECDVQLHVLNEVIRLRMLNFGLVKGSLESIDNILR